MILLDCELARYYFVHSTVQCNTFKSNRCTYIICVVDASNNFQNARIVGALLPTRLEGRPGISPNLYRITVLHVTPTRQQSIAAPASIQLPLARAQALSAVRFAHTVRLKTAGNYHGIRIRMTLNTCHLREEHKDTVACQQVLKLYADLTLGVVKCLPFLYCGDKVFLPFSSPTA